MEDNSEDDQRILSLSQDPAVWRRLEQSWHGFQWLWITVFSDDETEDRSSRMNSEEYRDILSKKLIERCFIVQMNNDPKHTAKATQEFLKLKSDYSAVTESIS